MDPGKVSLGALCLFVSSAISIQAGLLAARTPLLVVAVASLGLAGISVLLGGGDGTPDAAAGGRRNA